MKLQLHIETVRPVAHKIVQSIGAYCHRIDIAGSLRREKRIVGDIEILCLPKFVLAQTTFFESEPVRSPQFVERVRMLGKILSGDPQNGRYVKIMLAEGIQLDLFMPTANDYGRQLAIRTGPYLYSQNVIAAGWRRVGWVGTPGGLRRKSECEKKNDKWVCVLDKPTLPPAFPTEESFFDFIRTTWIAPQKRINE